MQHAAQIAPDGAVISFAQVAPSLIASNAAWVPCDASLIGADPSAWRYEGGEFLANGVRVVTEEMVRAEGERRLQLLAAQYQPGERETWSLQALRATEYLANNTAPVPGLRAMAAADGRTPDEWATAILANAAAFEVASFHIIGKQRALIDMSPIPANFENDTWWI